MVHAQIEYIYSPKDRVNVNSGLIRNSFKLKTTKMFINGRMDILIAIYSYQQWTNNWYKQRYGWILQTL